MMTKEAAPSKRRTASAPPEEDKRPRGRPTKAPEERLVGRSIRLHPESWDKIDLYGLEWLRKVIKRAKPPQE